LIGSPDTFHSCSEIREFSDSWIRTGTSTDICRSRGYHDWDCHVGVRHSWCLEREVDPFSAPLAFVLDFLAWMHFKGYEYRTINVHRSAISSVLPYIDGLPIGQLPFVKQLLPKE
jgi:hypothetical protein